MKRSIKRFDNQRKKFSESLVTQVKSRIFVKKKNTDQLLNASPSITESFYVIYLSKDADILCSVGGVINCNIDDKLAYLISNASKENNKVIVKSYLNQNNNKSVGLLVEILNLNQNFKTLQFELNVKVLQNIKLLKLQTIKDSKRKSVTYIENKNNPINDELIVREKIEQLQGLYRPYANIKTVQFKNESLSDYAVRLCSIATEEIVWRKNVIDDIEMITKELMGEKANEKNLGVNVYDQLAQSQHIEEKLNITINFFNEFIAANENEQQDQIERIEELIEEGGKENNSFIDQNIVYIDDNKAAPILKTASFLTSFNTIEEFRVAVNTLPDESLVREKANQELIKLRSIKSSELPETLNYLMHLLNVHSLRESRTVKNFTDIMNALNASHLGLYHIKERIIDFLALDIHTGLNDNTVLCLHGSAGTGKTSIAESIAKATGREFIRLSLAGLYDATIIKGHPRAYSGSTPGTITQLLIQCGTSNPVILLDDIDKVGSHSNDNAIKNLLLELLDNKYRKSFMDYYLQLPFDLSKAMIIVAANEMDNIPQALLDRLEIINFKGYNDLEKLTIARNYIIPRLQDEYCLNEYNIEISDNIIIEIIRLYTHEDGVRNLEKMLKILFQKIVKKVVMREINKDTLLIIENLDIYLGSANFHDQNNLIYLDDKRC